MQDRRRKLHGVPKRVRGQFDFEHREPSAALSATIAAEGSYVTGDDGLLRRTFDADTDGGYDTIELDPTSRRVRLLLGGAEHNTAGAAVWSWEGDERVSSWWLHGEQVDQVAVARLATGEPDVFDADFESGWENTAEGAMKVIDDSSDDAAAQDTVLRIAATLDQPVSDDEVMEDPAAAAEALGAARAARRMRKAMLQAILDGNDWRQAVRDVVGGSEPYLEQHSR